MHPLFLAALVLAVLSTLSASKGIDPIDLAVDIYQHVSNKKADKKQKAKAASASLVASSLLSFVSDRLETGYTTASHWSAFHKGLDSHVGAMMATQTEEPRVTGKMSPSKLTTVLAAVRTENADFESLYYSAGTQYIATQTHLDKKAKESMLADLKTYRDLTKSGAAAGPFAGMGLVGVVGIVAVVVVAL